MRYNLDFLIAALVFLLLLLYHFMSQKKLENFSSRIFRAFIFVGIADVLLDLICTVMIAGESSALAGLMRASLTVLYLMQVLVPFAFVCYAKSLRVTSEGQLRRIIRFWSVPTALLEILVLCNVWNGLFFTVTPEGVYIRGPLYLVIYFYVIVCVLAEAVDSFVHFGEYGLRKFCTIWEFMVIAAVCVLIQAYNNDLMMTGFGLCLGITVLYLTIHNPYGYTDNLTGLFDKQSFETWFRELTEKGRVMHLISIDVRRLKYINKMMGISVGDRMLLRVSEMLQDVSESEQVFRVGSKRFFLITNSLDEYERCRKQIQEFFSHSFFEEDENFAFPAVICGIFDAENLKESDTLMAYIEYLVSLIPDDEESTLIQGDDRTLEGFRYEQEIEHFLNTAIEEDLFEVYYQPVYSLAEERFVTMEALSRLRHPSFGMVSPEVFIDIAEKNRQIAQIGYLQFQRICRFLNGHREVLEQVRNVKVNLSPMELLKPGYSRMLIDTVRSYNLPFSSFQFEITETVATEYSEELRAAVAEFQEVGIGLCLDDFGSGYANLNTVLKLPFTSIKLDRTLLEGICEDRQAASFYRSIALMFKNMGYHIIAEGVETKDEVELLRGWGVKLIQGYYFSRPVDGAKLLELLGRTMPQEAGVGSESLL